MFGSMMRRPSRSKGEAEKPFWISFSDLMSAMMVLFLIAMAVTIAAVTRVIEGPQEIRAGQIRQVCESLKASLADDGNISVNCHDQRIKFGEVGRFALNSYRLPDEAEATIGRLVPAVLSAADSELGRKWLKQVIVEGYTDPVGGYLYNLHLSLQRSEWMMCLLMDPRRNEHLDLTPAQLSRVRQLFLAGGVSFNNQKDTADESRRVELRIQFYGLDEAHDQAQPEALNTAIEGDKCLL